MSPTLQGTDLQGMLQELRTNRRTQAALAGFVLIMGYLLYTVFAPSAPHARRAVDALGGGSDSRQLAALRRLPDLAALDQAGQLPPEGKAPRDIFVFETPLPPPVKAPPPPPPPPPPTPEELAAKALAEAKAAEFATRPQDLRYLGYFNGRPSGVVGAFMRGEEPLTLVQGALLKERWKLVAIQDVRAEFQNTKYPDLKLVLEAREGAGAATNQF